MTAKQSHHGRPIQGRKIPDSVIRTYAEMHRPVLHPAVFPVALPSFLARAYTDEGETVCDPFMGSGTTGVACVKTGRRFIGIELDPGYFEIAKKRIQKAIAEKSELLIA